MTKTKILFSEIQAIDENEYVRLFYPNYKAKDGTIKPAIMIVMDIDDSKWYWAAPKKDLYEN